VRLKAADVSKQHCRLLLKRGTVVVEDLDSANGTFVNGEAIEKAALEDGDVLIVAGYAFKVRLPKSD
jgi:pSer/pThr/pTyr-binding forkhead associated (FHA) protein